MARLLKFTLFSTLLLNGVCQAQEAFFEIADHQSTAVIRLTDAAKIQEARDIISAGRFKWVTGTIVKNPAWYNQPWNWHFYTPSISFADVTVEVCQASLQGIEDGLAVIGGPTLPFSHACAGSVVREVFPQRPACIYTLDRSNATASAAGDVVLARLEIIAHPAALCAWHPFSNVNWITPIVPAGDALTGPLRLMVAPNAGNAPRSGVVNVGGQKLTITQAANNCTYTLNPQTQTYTAPRQGGSSVVRTTANCSWTPASGAPWLPAFLGNNTVSGNFTYLVDMNTADTPRGGNISVGGQLLQILQLGANPQQAFTDVPVTHPFFGHIAMMRDRGVTNGCTATQYCPDSTTLRGQAAVFIVRAIYGDNFDYPATPYFTDVPPNHQFFKYVQRLRQIGVTAGCGDNRFCPDALVTRGEMAAFLVRARFGLSSADNFPFPTTPYFADVPAAHAFFPFIQKMKDHGITSGCSATSYCPNDYATRGQMAAFVVRALLAP